MNKMLLASALAGGVALLGASAAEAAVVVTTADGNGADTYVANDASSGSDFPDANFGAGGSIEVRSLDNSRQRIGLIRFDISGATGDLGGATIDLYGTANRTRRYAVYGVNEANDDFVENEVTFNNFAGVAAHAPGSSTDFPGFAFLNFDVLTDLGDFVSTETDSNVQQANFSSAALDSFLASDTDGNVAFLIAFNGVDGSDEAIDPSTGLIANSDSNPNLHLNTKEATITPTVTPVPPTLTLPNAVIPEPTSLALLGVGGLGLLRRRWA